MTAVLQYGEWKLSVISHMTKETNQFQAFHPHSMVNVVDLFSRQSKHFFNKLHLFGEREKDTVAVLFTSM